MTTAIVIAVIVVLLLLIAVGLLIRSRRPDPAQQRVEARARLAEAGRHEEAAADAEKTAGELGAQADEHAKRARDLQAKADEASAAADERRQAAAAQTERARKIDPDR